MALKTSDLNAKLFGKADKRRASNPVEAQAAAKDRAQIIELAVAGEQVITFELMTIAAAEIEQKTQVFAENAREQAFLNEHALADILSTLRERGQQYPAVGRKTASGMIEVLDGSRRRKSCLLANRDFLIYVAEGINSEHAKFLSDVANAHKPLSLYEKGREMQLKLEAGEAEDQKALAKMFQCSEALVSGALKAATLPLALLQAYPNVVELGRPTIVKLHKQFTELSPEQQQQLLEQCQQDEQQVWQRCQAQGIARITKEVTETLESWMKTLGQPKKKELAKVSRLNGRLAYSRKGTNLTINVKKVTDEAMQEILDFIEAKLK